MKCKGATNKELWGQIIDEVDFFKGSNILGRPQKFGKSILLSFDVTKQISKRKINGFIYFLPRPRTDMQNWAKFL